MVITYTNHDGLVDATCQVLCKSPNRSSCSEEYFERLITYMGMAAIVAMPIYFIFLILKSLHTKFG